MYRVDILADPDETLSSELVLELRSNGVAVWLSDLPANLEELDRLVEALEGHPTTVFEDESLSYAELPDDIRGEDLAAVGTGARPRGELDRCPEEAVVLGDRLSRRDPIRTRNGTSAVSLCWAIFRWMVIAHSIARTTDVKDAMIPSPA
jgi:hypothetical protein